MRYSRKCIWDRQNEIQLLLPPIVEPSILISLALSDERPELGDTLIVPAVEKPGIDFITLDVADVQCVDLSQDRRQPEHA